MAFDFGLVYFLVPIKLQNGLANTYKCWRVNKLASSIMRGNEPFSHFSGRQESFYKKLIRPCDDSSSLVDTPCTDYTTLFHRCEVLSTLNHE